MSNALKVKERFEILKSMNTIVKSMNNEGAYYNNWIYLIPDEADDDELLDIAENYKDIFDEACEIFAAIIQKYAKDGFYIADELFGVGRFCNEED